MKKTIALLLLTLFSLTIMVSSAEAAPKQPWRKSQNKINRSAIKQNKKNNRQNRRAMIAWEEVCHA